MTRHDDDMLHAFIDGELGVEDRAAFERQMAGDPALGCRVAAFAADKARLAAVFRPMGERPVPEVWTARIAAHRPAPPALLPWPVLPPRFVPRFVSRRAAAWIALAACALAIAGGWWGGLLRPGDTILADAAAARDQTLAPLLHLAGSALPQQAARDAILHTSLHLNVRAPDLGRFGYRLVELDTYHSWRGGPAVGMRHRDSAARELTIYARKSSGEARSDLLRSGTLRVCIWQDDVVGAVMTGEMTADEMMRIASAAYANLDL